MAYEMATNAWSQTRFQIEERRGERACCYIAVSPRAYFPMPEVEKNVVLIFMTFFLPSLKIIALTEVVVI